ncbi:MAG: FAD-linked oxidase C-terminal domain-containing protein [bacterium]
MVVESLQKDLSRLISGEVFTDPVSREIYSTAACLYRIVPMAVARPVNADEAAKVVAFASERGIPVTPRGAGTAVAGQTLGEGIVLDLTCHLNRIVEVDADKRKAVVEPGVILGDLNKSLKSAGLMFPPDPSSGDYATVGGMIANNSSGSHALKYKDTRRWTSRLKCVLADGSMTWLEQKPVMPEKTAFESGVFENRIYGGLPPLLHKYGESLEGERPRVEKNSAGYHVWDLLEGRHLTPVPLVVGSEGTLAMVVKAELELAFLPEKRRAVLIAFRSLENAVDTVQNLRELSPAAIEIMDHMFIETVREHRRDLREFLPEKAHALLLVEFESDSDSEDELASRVQDAQKAAGGDSQKVVLFKAASGEHETRLLWEVRKAASPILYRLPGKRLTRFVEDVVVPPDKLAQAIRGIQHILKKHGTEAPVLGHAGSGNLHLNPRLDLTDPRDRENMKRIAEEVYSLVIELNGSITGEHGDGILRAPYLAKQFPSLYPLFREIKKLFDPQGIMNPGKIISDDREIPADRLKHKGKPENAVPCALHEERSMEMLLRCHGCGLCRNYCPVTRVRGEELALPRSKISLLRAVAQGELDASEPSVRAGLDRVFALCTLCQRCLTGCPTGIETARLIHAFYRDRPVPPNLREILPARLPVVLPAMSRFPRLSSAMLENRLIRSMMEKTAGIRKEAPLPRPWPHAPGSGVKEGAGASTEVAYFPGCLGKYADPDGETEAAIKMLSALGFDVHITDLPCCGEPAIVSNRLDEARSKAEQFVRAAKKCVDEDVPIVTGCPACALTLRYKYPWLLGDMAGGLSGRVFELFQFVDENVEHETLGRVFKWTSGESVINFRSCHYAAMSGTDHVGRVMQEVDGLSIVLVNQTCCGMAGTYGLKTENREVSEELADSLARSLQEAGPGTVISGCPLCRLQIKRLGYDVESPAVFLKDMLS